MKNYSLKIGVIIPAFNPQPEELQRVLKGVLAFCTRVIVVDDGSQPALNPKLPGNCKIKILRHGENRGKGEALKTGFRYFLTEQAVDAVLTLDADLQHPPEMIPRFLQKFYSENTPLVTGFRKRDPQIMPLHRILSNTLTSLIISLLTGQLVRDSQCGFRLISSDVLRSISLKESRFHLESELLVRAGWRGYRIGSVPIPTIYSNRKSAIKNLPDTLNFISLVLKLIWERLSG